MGLLTPRYASIYDACARRIYTQPGIMDHDQRASSIPSLAKPKLIMQAGLFWVRLGRFEYHLIQWLTGKLKLHLDRIVSGKRSVQCLFCLFGGMRQLCSVCSVRRIPECDCDCTDRTFLAGSEIADQVSCSS